MGKPKVRALNPPDPVTGPIPREVFAKAILAPYGGAKKIIREYDPLWGIAPGDKIRWKVEAMSKQWGEAFVEADSQEEADQKADELDESDFDWDYSSGDVTIISVEIDGIVPSHARENFWDALEKNEE